MIDREEDEGFAMHITERCLGMVRESSMDEDQWLWTRLESVHDELREELDLKVFESPIVSFRRNDLCWYVLTNFRVLGRHGSRFAYEPLAVASEDWGDFKTSLVPELGEARLGLHAGTTQILPFETGKASMGPIQYFKYWHLKHHVWAKTFELSRREKD